MTRIPRSVRNIQVDPCEKYGSPAWGRSVENFSSRNNFGTSQQHSCVITLFFFLKQLWRETLRWIYVRRYIQTAERCKNWRQHHNSSCFSNVTPHSNRRRYSLLRRVNLCTPTKKKEIIHLAHDNPTSGYFGYTITLARLQKYHCRYKSQDFYEYCRACATCQFNKHGRVKVHGDPQPLELPEHWCGSVAMDFITHFQTTEYGYECSTIFVDRFLRRVDYVGSENTDVAFDVGNCLFDNIFRVHGISNVIVPDPNPNLPSSCGLTW